MRRTSAIVAAGALLALGLVVPTTATAGPLVEKADEWVPSQIQPTKIPLRWSRATLDDKVKLDELGRRPTVNADQVTFLLACEKDRQLDCVESIGLVSMSGEYMPGQLAYGMTTDHPGFPDRGVKPYAWHRTVWNIPGLVVDGKPAQIRFEGGLGGEGSKGSPGLNMDLQLHGVNMIPSKPNGPRGCFDPFEACSIPPDFPKDSRIRVVLRTSWLAPAGVGARGTDVTLSSEDLGGGAHRWTMTGNPMLVQSRGGREEIDRGYSTFVVSSFYFMMSDPRLGNPASECAVFRPILFSSNAQDLDIPRWNPSQGRLDLRMAAPHYWSDRKTEWRGYYESSIPVETARCLWGIDPKLTNYLSVGVYSEDGEEKAATTSIGLSDGQVQIKAYDFTFSSNIVSAKINVKAGKPCFTKGVKIKNLICSVNGRRLVWVKSGR